MNTELAMPQHHFRKGISDKATLKAGKEQYQESGGTS